MRLEAGIQIGRYEIQSLLGKGGMGEVYLARDTELQRPVALKLMFKSEDASRLRRFRQEARAASALSHPNILTVFDFGVFEDLHYMITERIRGETLRQKFSGGKLNCAEALSIAIQIGCALAAAHETGIVHRDIKPENVMVLPDGHVKVLDFGLAKLVNFKEALGPVSQASTVSLLATNPGMIIGTVNYMSPEQLRGQDVDQRSDIWSLGVVLFEMVAEHRPFTGDSTSDVIAAILEHPVTQLTPARADCPIGLDRILAKALAKDKESRYQSAAEFVAAMTEVRQELELEARLQSDPGRRPSANPAGPVDRALAGINSASSSNTAGVPTGNVFSRSRLVIFVSLAAIVLLLAVGIWFVISALRSNPAAKGPLAMKPLTTANNILDAVISPDGRFYVYTQSDQGQQSLWLGQVNGSGAKELMPPGKAVFKGLAFAPDGNSIYFSAFGLKENTTSGTLFRIGGVLGGTPQELIDNVDSTVTFSPDAKRFAFIRSLPEGGVDRLIVANANGANETVLAERKRPNFFSINSREAPSWSPDGELIACPAGANDETGEYMNLITINVRTGQERVVTPQRWSRIGRTWWSNQGQAIFFNAADVGSDLYQIMRADHVSGKVTKLTVELNDYSNLSLTADSKVLLAVVADKTSGVFVTPNENADQSTNITSGKYDGYWGLTWTPEGEVVYVSLESGDRDLWVRRPHDRAQPRQLTFDKASDDYPSVSPDGQSVVFVSNRAGSPNLWRMNRTGSDLKQLTHGDGEWFPRITSDSRSVIYSARNRGPWSLWRIPVNGGEPVRLTTKLSHWPTLSRDGRWVACLSKEDSIDEPVRLAVVSLADGSVAKTFDLPKGAIGSPAQPPVLDWSPDSQGVMYVVTQDGVSNLWVQPMAGGPPKKLTDFTADRIFWFEWSKDGKQLAYARGVLRNDLVLIENF